ncbi:hypothetical protein [Methanosarcina acetivorans]|uniref:hypothetical protein n=1 Tax=Methanosarcina acetivorans TaxID=2214 RepID=UPI000AE122FE|nr:hypothetical protein [Methanosarcina acetivorans]
MYTITSFSVIRELAELQAGNINISIRIDNKRLESFLLAFISMPPIEPEEYHGI